MFTTRGNEWIACLTIAAILELYTAFRIPQEEEKKKSQLKKVLRILPSYSHKSPAFLYSSAFQL